MSAMSATNVTWMVMIGTLGMCAAYYIGLCWQSILKFTHPRSKRISQKPVLQFARAGRGNRLKRFERIARDVVVDVESALQPPHCHHHARSLIPLISDVRRRGELLLSQQTGTHRITAPEREMLLETLVSQLFSLESRLKALPKPKVTIEEVLSGKFE
ncbi:hypothetical protein EBU99_09295 [bacterium]|nr:hypothetical protein [bacterium]